MANGLITSELVSKAMLARFVASNSFINRGSRGLEGDFTQKAYTPGQTVAIRKRNRFKAGDGQSATAQGITDSVEQVTLNHQYNVMVDMTTLEEGYDLASFTEQIIQPAVDAINAKMNADIYALARQQVNYVTGSTSQALTQSALFDAQAFMTKLQMSRGDRTLVLSPTDGADLNSVLYNTFNQDFNKPVIYDGRLGQFAGFEIYEDEVITPVTSVGSFPGTPVLASAPASGASSLAVSGFTTSQTNVLLAGDIISIANVNSVTPLYYSSTGELMTFVVTANVNSDGSGNATVPIAPAIIWDSTSTLQNVDSEPQAGAALALVAARVPNIAFTRSGLDIVCPPLPMLKTPECYVQYDSKYNVAIRLAADADITESENIYRFDVLCGFGWHQQYATQLLSQV